MNEFTENELETVPEPQEREMLLLEVASEEAAAAQAAELWRVSVDDLETVVLESGKRLFGLFG
ncbi:MAG: hypothetical protein LBS93_00445, partial [Synergistaceae bacterium]|nr:hypothetical protein [Synergistaceae bacterium]